MSPDGFSTRIKHFSCPCCGERISAVLDLSVAYQRYFEDCEVCCQSIEIVCRVEAGVLVSFETGTA